MFEEGWEEYVLQAGEELEATMAPTGQGLRPSLKQQGPRRMIKKVGGRRQESPMSPGYLPFEEMLASESKSGVRDGKTLCDRIELLRLAR